MFTHIYKHHIYALAEDWRRRVEEATAKVEALRSR